MQMSVVGTDTGFEGFWARTDTTTGNPTKAANSQATLNWRTRQKRENQREKLKWFIKFLGKRITGAHNRNENLYRASENCGRPQYFVKAHIFWLDECAACR